MLQIEISKAEKTREVHETSVENLLRKWTTSNAKPLSRDIYGASLGPQRVSSKEPTDDPDRSQGFKPPREV